MLLVDTNVVSMIFKRDSRAALYEPYLTGALKGISFMRRAELALWPLVAGWGHDKSSRLEEFLKDYTVLPHHEDLSEAWAKVRFPSQRRGRQLTHADAWIAATALLYHVPLVTHNRRHFEGVDRLQGYLGRSVRD